MVDPGAQREEPAPARRRRACSASYGFFEAIDYTDRGTARRIEPATRHGRCRAYFAHHAGMSLVALANALQRRRMVERFHADPRVQATELLLQERVPRQRPITEPRPRRRDARVAAERRRAGAPLPHAAHDRSRTRSSCRTASTSAAVTNAGGGASFCDRHGGHAVAPRPTTRSGQPASSTCATSAAARSGRRPIQPTRREPDELPRDVPARDGDRSTHATRSIATKLEVAVSPEHDVEVRLLHADQPRRSRARDRRHELRRDRARRSRATTSRIRRSASCSSKPSICRSAPRCSATAGRAIRAIPARGRCTC